MDEASRLNRGLELVPRNPDANYPNVFLYDIHKDGRKTDGTLIGKVDGDTADIAWMGGDRPNELGVSGLRQLREAFRRDYPNVKHFTGGRISGARSNGDESVKQSVTILSDQSRASVPGTVLNSIGGQTLPERAFREKSMDQAQASTRPDTGLGHLDSVPGANMNPSDFSDYLAKKYGVKVDLAAQRSGDFHLQHIEVPRGERGKGVGSAVMEEIAKYADEHGKRVLLTPALKDDNFGTTSRRRLVDFYKRHGYVENKGRNKDFTTREGMYRDVPERAFKPKD